MDYYMGDKSHAQLCSLHLENKEMVSGCTWKKGSIQYSSEHWFERRSPGKGILLGRWEKGGLHGACKVLPWKVSKCWKMYNNLLLLQSRSLTKDVWTSSDEWTTGHLTFTGCPFHEERRSLGFVLRKPRFYLVEAYKNTVIFLVTNNF